MRCALGLVALELVCTSAIEDARDGGFILFPPALMDQHAIEGIQGGFVLFPPVAMDADWSPPADAYLYHVDTTNDDGVQWWVWLLVVLGILMFLFCGCMVIFFLRERRKHASEEVQELEGVVPTVEAPKKKEPKPPKEEPVDILVMPGQVASDAEKEEEQAEEAAKRKAKEDEERRKAEEKSRREAEAEATKRAENEARADAEAEARRKAEDEARRKADDEARRKAEDEAREKAEDEARRKAEDDARKKAEDEARKQAEDEARRKAEDESKRKAEDEARRQAEDKANKIAEEAVSRAAEDEAKRSAEDEAKRQAEAEARRKAEDEEKRRAEDEARRAAGDEAKRIANDEAKRMILDSKRKAAEEARAKAEKEARRKAEEERAAEVQARSPSPLAFKDYYKPNLLPTAMATPALAPLSFQSHHRDLAESHLRAQVEEETLSSETLTSAIQYATAKEVGLEAVWFAEVVRRRRAAVSKLKKLIELLPESRHCALESACWQEFCGRKMVVLEDLCDRAARDPEAVLEELKLMAATKKKVQ